jgi:uncharacterized protein
VKATSDAVRRLAVVRQRLAGVRPGRDREAIHGLVRELGCLQLDPTSAVARSQLLVLWSRLGRYDVADLDALLWEERRLFEYWAHAASIVPVEDLAIHEATGMRPRSRRKTAWAERERAWAATNRGMRRRILDELRARGPLRSSELETGPAALPRSLGWPGERDVAHMLAILWERGEVAVAGRAGQARLWDLADRVLPLGAVRRTPMRMREAVTVAAERSLRALGVATPLQIGRHFIRGRYNGLPAVLRTLERKGRIHRVELDAVPGEWLVHADDLGLLRQFADDVPARRSTLLSPFDNLICDRERTAQLFDFDFRLEIYAPVAKRRYGFFVMPVLAGDRLIGRIDPRYDRRERRLVVNAVHREPGVSGSELEDAVSPALEDLAAFLGAEEIVRGRRR